MKNCCWTVLLLITMAIGAPCQERPAQWSAAPAPGKAIQPGEKFSVKLSAKISSGWHMYSITQPSGGPTTTVISIPKMQPFRLDGQISGPPPLTAYDANFEMNTETYEDHPEFAVPVSVSPNTPAGDQKLAIDVRFQVCNDTTCMPATTEHLRVPVSIKAIKAAATPVGKSLEQKGQVVFSAPLPDTSSSSAAVEKNSKEISVAGLSVPRQSMGSFLWLAVMMGGLSLLTPCVFPMIPMTVSYFVNHSGTGRRSAVNTALLYGLGIILTFTALGLLLAIIFGAGGVNKLAANPWVNLLITAIFLGFAFSLLGAYFIQVPPALTNRLDSLTRSKEGTRVVGALLMGSTFTLTSFTCTAPFVGTLLVMATQGNWRWPLAGMLAFSTVFAVPFFFLALAPQVLSQLPKSGGWMISVKVVVGFLEVAAAMKFLSNADLVWRWGIFTRQVVLATWVGIGILTVLYILGYLRMAHEEARGSVGAGRLIVAMVVLAATIWLVPGLFGRQLGGLEAFLPPEMGAISSGAIEGPRSNSDAEVHWVINDYEGALARAKRENMPVFIDFTGYTCTNCRWMEANMFSKPEVSRELKRYICVRLYTDGDGEIFQRQQSLQQKTFGTVALPFYAILSVDGSVSDTFPGLTKSESEFLAFLTKR
ncbi:thiol:disulfide interchange protein DsbD [Edaphobacter aggregans]|uniref:Thiol:disulfide interchange protein DsbD n=1 Tax=Edaphobacter aggregans TaxID=570835 RepID=A0A3R9R1P7_9BACT|nr:cytochrome c biogenesis protein CcdA [Edaphobacter aggregans]RSL15779.1 thiol:disulfide interchange protein DsbD [Edaphobacter aggregans]